MLCRREHVQPCRLTAKIWFLILTDGQNMVPSSLIQRQKGTADTEEAGRATAKL